MKIVDNRKDFKSERFSQLQAGDVFLDSDEDISIKVIDSDTKDYCAVVLRNGLLWFPSDDSCVIRLNTRLTVED